MVDEVVVRMRWWWWWMRRNKKKGEEKKRKCEEARNCIQNQREVRRSEAK